MRTYLATSCQRTRRTCPTESTCPSKSPCGRAASGNSLRRFAPASKTTRTFRHVTPRAGLHAPYPPSRGTTLRYTPSQARFFVDDEKEVHALLAQLANLSQQLPPPEPSSASVAGDDGAASVIFAAEEVPPSRLPRACVAAVAAAVEAGAGAVAAAAAAAAAAREQMSAE